MRYSIVVPVFNEKDSLPELAERIATTMSGLGAGSDYELILVDDGSTDGSREVIKALGVKDPCVRRVFLRRNCGKATALSAGFALASGKRVVTIDADLQDAPEDIPKLAAELDKGFDLVSGWRQKRQDTGFRIWGSRVFNAAVSALSGLRLHDFNCGFKLYRSEVVKQVRVYGQHHRFIPLLAHVIGFKVSEAEVRNADRRYGVSKYPAFRYHGLFDLLSILFTYKYRFSPLHFFGAVGLFFMVPGGLVVSWLIGTHALYLFGFGTQYMLANRPLLALGFTTFMLGANIFLTGFVCDFVLHHAGAVNLNDSTAALIEESA